MTVTVRASSAADFGSGSGTSLTLPAGGQVGDPVLLVITTNGATNVPSALTGWTLIDSAAIGTGTRMWWKRTGNFQAGDTTVAPAWTGGVTVTQFEAAFVILNSTAHSGFGTAGTVTTRGSSITTTTAASTGTTGDYLVVSWEKAATHATSTFPTSSPSVTLVCKSLPTSASSPSVFVGSYSGSAASVTLTYETASSNGAAVQMPLVAATTAVTVSETGSGVDALAAAATLADADTGHGADALAAAAAVPVGETAAGTDTVAVAVAVPLTDPRTVADALAVAAAATLTDTGTAADALAVTVTTALADTAAGSDILPAPPATVHLTDVGAGADGLNVVQGNNVTLPETATGADALTSAAAAPVADVATGSDALALTVTVTAADLAAAADQLATAALLTLGEQAATVDALTILRQQAVDIDAHASLPAQIPQHAATLTAQTSRYRAATVSRTTYTAHLEAQ